MGASLFSLSPLYRVERDRLIARSSLLARALTLFSWERQVIVDRAAGWIILRSRFLWLFRRGRTIPFRRVRHIEYRYGAGVLGTWEMFVVQIVTRDPEEQIDLLTFAGDDPERTDLPELLVGSVGGDQQERSLGYIELLSRFVGVPIGHRPEAAPSRREGL